MPIRQAILSIHRWTGLTVGLAIMLAAVTGLAMVFRPQLEPLVDGELKRVASCSERMQLDALVQRAREVHPDVAIRQLEIAQAGFGATVVRFKDTQGVHLDPCTGAVLGMRSRWAGPFNRIEQFHRWRFLEDGDLAGMTAGSVALTCTLVMGIGGLTVWWPSNRRQWKNAWKLRTNLKGAAFEINLHRTFGAYAALVVIGTTVAAQTLAFDWARDLVYWVTGSPLPTAKPAASTSALPAQPMERLFATILEAVPAAGYVILPFPGKAGESVEAQVAERGAPHPNAYTLVALDPSNGAVLRLQPYATASAGYRTYRWLASLHMGYIGGLFGQLVLFLGVLSIPILGYTGIRSFLRRQQRPRP